MAIDLARDKKNKKGKVCGRVFPSMKREAKKDHLLFQFPIGGPVNRI
jgi:hypothetical protein